MPSRRHVVASKFGSVPERRTAVAPKLHTSDYFGVPLMYTLGETDVAGNLEANLLLCIGARVMLTRNIWTERGLVNGTLGTLRDIVWSPDSPHDAPFALLVEIDDYNGSAVEGLVPIFRSRQVWYRGNAMCSRTQFPIVVASAMTIHKAQGITVRWAVLRLGRDFIPGLTYVALSRLKSLTGLVINESFNLEQLKFKSTELTVMRAQDAVKREAQRLVYCPTFYVLTE